MNIWQSLRYRIKNPSFAFWISSWLIIIIKYLIKWISINMKLTLKSLYHQPLKRSMLCRLITHSSIQYNTYELSLEKFWKFMRFRVYGGKPQEMLDLGDEWESWRVLYKSAWYNRSLGSRLNQARQQEQRSDCHRGFEAWCLTCLPDMWIAFKIAWSRDHVAGGIWIPTIIKTIVEADIPQVECAKHGVKQMPVTWAEQDSRFTAEFESTVFLWLKGD